MAGEVQAPKTYTFGPGSYFIGDPWYGLPFTVYGHVWVRKYDLAAGLFPEGFCVGEVPVPGSGSIVTGSDGAAYFIHGEDFGLVDLGRIPGSAGLEMGRIVDVTRGLSFTDSGDGVFTVAADDETIVIDTREGKFSRWDSLREGEEPAGYCVQAFLDLAASTLEEAVSGRVPAGMPPVPWYGSVIGEAVLWLLDARNRCGDRQLRGYIASAFGSISTIADILEFTRWDEVSEGERNRAVRDSRRASCEAVRKIGLASWLLKSGRRG